MCDNIKKQKRSAISLETKIKILDCLAKGERSTAVGKRFHLGESTIRAIKKNEAAIRKSVRSGTNLSSKISSYSRDTLIEKTEKALVIWIEDLTQKRIPLDGHLIKMKALKFYKELKESEPSTSSRESNPQFSASTGWLTGFIKRHSFHNLKIKGEVASADEEAARKYPEKLAKIIKDGEYCAHQVFNADETGLFWKKMPTPIAEIKSQTLNACWKAAWPECVSKGNESNRAIVTSEIISIAKEIGGESFDDFGGHDIEELLVDEALNDDDILESMVDITKDLETVDSEPEEDVTPLDEKLLREGLQLSVPEEALPCRSDDVILSSSDESDLANPQTARISAAAGEIRNTPEMLSNVRRSMKRRCEACITCGGRQFEHLL
ncbi:tigger transposable element-derived protein 1 [Trichonephila clavipes]|nr:tigger transposable element-derived protein 1 [Trichonephila clavipes]